MSLKGPLARITQNVATLVKDIEKILVGGRDEVTIGRNLVVLLKDTNTNIRSISGSLDEEDGSKLLAKMRDVALLARELITILLAKDHGPQKLRRKKVLCVTIRLRANQLQRLASLLVGKLPHSTPVAAASTPAPPVDSLAYGGTHQPSVVNQGYRAAPHQGTPATNLSAGHILQEEERIDASYVVDGDEVDVDAELDDALSSGDPSPRSPVYSPLISPAAATAREDRSPVYSPLISPAATSGTTSGSSSLSRESPPPRDNEYVPQWKSSEQKAKMIEEMENAMDSGVSPELLSRLTRQLALKTPSQKGPMTISVLISSNPEKSSDILRHAASALSGEPPTAPHSQVPSVPSRRTKTVMTSNPSSPRHATSAGSSMSMMNSPALSRKASTPLVDRKPSSRPTPPDRSKSKDALRKFGRSKTLRRLAYARQDTTGGTDGPHPPNLTRRDTGTSSPTRKNSADRSPDSTLIFTDDDRKPRIQAASPARLVEYLTSADDLDVEFRKAFLLTFRGFMSAHEVMDLLIERFNLKQESQKNVQLRVITVLKMWASNYYQDFDDKTLLEKLKGFTTESTSAFSTVAERIYASVKAELMKDKKRTSDRNVSIMQARSLTSGVSLNDLDTSVLAEQMTLLDAHYFQRIRPNELMNQNWSKSDGKTTAPNIKASIDRFNVISSWYIWEIVSHPKLTDRIARLKRIISLGKIFLDMGNFNGMFGVVGALGNSAIARLKKTWGGLDSKSKEDYDVISAISSHNSNYKAYRDAMHSWNPPCLPYIGVYLTDLTFIEEGNPNTVKGGLVNWVKRELIAKVIEEIGLYQSVPFRYKEDLIILTRLEGMESFSNEESYQASLRIEPRNTDEALEKMLMEADKAKATIEQLQVKIADLQATIEDLQVEKRALAQALSESRREKPLPTAMALQSQKSLPPTPSSASLVPRGSPRMQRRQRGMRGGSMRPRRGRGRV